MYPTSFRKTQENIFCHKKWFVDSKDSIHVSILADILHKKHRISVKNRGLWPLPTYCQWWQYIFNDICFIKFISIEYTFIHSINKQYRCLLNYYHGTVPFGYVWVFWDMHRRIKTDNSKNCWYIKKCTNKKRRKNPMLKSIFYYFFGEKHAGQMKKTESAYVRQNAIKNQFVYVRW